VQSCFMETYEIPRAPPTLWKKEPTPLLAPKYLARTHIQPEFWNPKPIPTPSSIWKPMRRLFDVGRVDRIEHATANSRDARADYQEWPISSSLPHNTTTDCGRENKRDKEWDDVNAGLLGGTTTNEFIEEWEIIGRDIQAQKYAFHEYDRSDGR